MTERNGLPPDAGNRGGRHDACAIPQQPVFSGAESGLFYSDAVCRRLRRRHRRRAQPPLQGGGRAHAHHCLRRRRADDDRLQIRLCRPYGAGREQFPRCPRSGLRTHRGPGGQRHQLSVRGRDLQKQRYGQGPDHRGRDLDDRGHRPCHRGGDVCRRHLRHGARVCAAARHAPLRCRGGQLCGQLSAVYGGARTQLQRRAGEADRGVEGAGDREQHHPQPRRDRQL